MSAAVASSRVARPRVVSVVLQPRAALVLVAAASTVVRAAAATLNARPIYMPDEYLYTAIARALGAGHLPAVRGNPVHFPGLLAPLLAAPLQAAFSPEVAYRLTQFENAFVMSLAVFPVYAIARGLRLSARYGVACALFAVAIPDLVYASVTASDAVAYPLVLSALAVGIAALDEPRWRLQAAFLALAALAVSARVQYVVVPVAYLFAAVVVDRRAAIRRHAVVVGALLGCGLVVLAAGPSRVVGIYSATLHFHLDEHVWRWGLLDLFFLTCSIGAVLVPGAVAGLISARERHEVSFAAVTTALAGLLVTEAALFASNVGGRFEERYLFILVPLVPLAFGVYLRNGRPSPRLVLVLAGVLIIVAAKVQLTGYVGVSDISDSPFLIGYSRVVLWLGVSNAAVLAAVATTTGAVGAMGVAWRGRGAAALVATLMFTAVTAGVAVASYAHFAVGDRPAPDGLSWIDNAHVGDVTYVRTPRTPISFALQDLYWNRSIDNEVRVARATPTDGYAPVPKLRINADGTLVGVGHVVAFEEYASFARWVNATVLGHDDVAELVSSAAAPRLSLLELGRYFDGWLANSGRITIWPTHGRTTGTLEFFLRLPRNRRATTITFGRLSYRVRPGRTTPVRLHVDEAGPVTISFRSSVSTVLSQLRVGSVMSTPPAFMRSN